MRLRAVGCNEARKIGASLEWQQEDGGDGGGGGEEQEAERLAAALPPRPLRRESRRIGSGSVSTARSIVIADELYNLEELSPKSVGKRDFWSRRSGLGLTSDTELDEICQDLHELVAHARP